MMRERELSLPSSNIRVVQNMMASFAPSCINTKSLVMGKQDFFDLPILPARAYWHPMQIASLALQTPAPERLRQKELRLLFESFERAGLLVWPSV